MKTIMPELKGKADGSVINQVVAKTLPVNEGFSLGTEQRIRYQG